MADQTSVPSVEFTPTGLVVPQESAVLAGVQADMNAAFGGNLNQALNTPQGQLASSTTAIIQNTNDTFAEFVNQIDPDTASGFMQDAIARIYFLDRSPGEPTSVECVCVGAFGTVIPDGARGQDTSGNNYVCVGGGTIPIGGSITLPFACTVDGPTPCPANTLTIIYQAIPGWDSINNPADGVPGALVESQAAFAYRRAQSVALNAHGSPDAVYAAVFDVPDVIDVFVVDNPEATIVDYGSTNYPLAKNSVYVAAVGGDPDAIAKAIWTKKDLGCNTNGNTTVVVVDPNYAPSAAPQYPIKFEVPPTLPILFAVEISSSSGLPANIVALTQAAIIAAFNGADGSNRVRIGSLLLASKFYAPIVSIGPEVSVISILLGSSTPTLTAQQIGIDQQPTVAAGDIMVTLV